MHMAMVLTTLGSGGASHRTLSRYVASLLAAKSRFSRRTQIAFAYRSELVVCLPKQRLSLICALAYILGPVAPGYLERSWNPHPLRSTLIDACVMASLGAGTPAPIACAISITNAWICILVPHIGKWSITPSAKNPTKILTYWKMFSYPHVLYYLC